MIATGTVYPKYIQNQFIYPSKGNFVVVNIGANKKQKVTTSISEFRKQISPQGVPEPKHRDLFEDVEVAVSADTDQIFTIDILVSALDAFSTPSTQEEIDLGFDPDDYPLI